MHEISSGDSIADIDRRLWLELTPEQYGLVRELIRQVTEVPVVGIIDETERVVAAVAAHFPAFGPAILTVAEHVIERGTIYEDGEAVRPCCDGVRRADGGDPTA